MTIWMKPQRFFSAQDAAFWFNGEENFNRLIKAGWLKPVPGKARGMDYDLKDMECAADRVKLEGWPKA